MVVVAAVQKTVSKGLYESNYESCWQFRKTYYNYFHAFQEKELFKIYDKFTTSSSPPSLPHPSVSPLFEIKSPSNITFNNNNNNRNYRFCNNRNSSAFLKRRNYQKLLLGSYSLCYWYRVQKQKKKNKIRIFLRAVSFLLPPLFSKLPRFSVHVPHSIHFLS